MSKISGTTSCKRSAGGWRGRFAPGYDKLSPTPLAHRTRFNRCSYGLYDQYLQGFIHKFGQDALDWHAFHQHGSKHKSDLEIEENYKRRINKGCLLCNRIESIAFDNFSVV